jgi:hypothetical protein
MSSEPDDVPLGGESRRYYERKFGDRIRRVSKSGGTRPNSGGSNKSGCVGAGVAVGIIIVVLRLIIAVSNSRSGTPSYTYTPPPILKPVLAQKQEEPELPPRFRFQPGRNDDEREADPSLKEDDVPVLEGLCLRIHDESQEKVATPGRRIWTLLDAASRKPLAKAASGQALDPNEKLRLFGALNRILAQPVLYDGASFARIGQVEPLRLQFNINQIEKTCRKYNRSLLEKCYPDQIMPYRERDWLTREERQAFQARAQTDLELAKLERLLR